MPPFSCFYPLCLPEEIEFLFLLLFTLPLFLLSFPRPNQFWPRVEEASASTAALRAASASPADVPAAAVPPSDEVAFYAQMQRRVGEALADAVAKGGLGQ